jgi:protein phosphatase
MFSLEDHVSSYDGMLVVGDVHSDFRSFSMALDFAISENFFFMSLGDLVDRGDSPYEVIEAMYERMDSGHAGMTVGNHDSKFVRLHKGRTVTCSDDNRRTLELVGPDRRQKFLDMYTSVVEDSMLAGAFHKFGDIRLVHAASHPCLWADPINIGGKATSRFLYGETVNELDEDGYPIRLYNWIEEVPSGKTIIVGHDRKPINNVSITEPMIVESSSGGKTVFLDTGCGKGGFLSGAVVLHSKSVFKLDKFMEFK